MARIRSIHPNQWTDVDFVSCSPLARLLAIGLRNEADDHGIFVWEPLQLKIRLLPADNVDISDLLKELSDHNLVRKFGDQSAKQYGVIRNFRRFQRPEKPKFIHPFPDSVTDYAGQSTKDGDPGGGSRRPVADQSANCAPEGTVAGAEGGNGGGNGRASAPPPRKSRLDSMLQTLKDEEEQELEHGKH